MSSVKRWLGKSKTRKQYEEEKREFEMAIGKPHINLKIELPENFNDMRIEFLKLENNIEFIDEVSDLIKKRLILKKKKTVKI